MKDLLDRIVNATVKGDETRAVALAHEAMAKDLDPFKVIQQGYARGMEIVGGLFARLEYFLPEVMLAADAMTAALEVLKPHLQDRENGGSSGTIVIATIQGDLHDLGKNIVKVMLEAAGFTVYDMGADVAVSALIAKAQEVEADIIAASAILTTTMAHMPDIAKILAELGIRDHFRIMLGGAPVIREWAFQAGADGYGEDAAEAVETARQLMVSTSIGAQP